MNHDKILNVCVITDSDTSDFTSYDSVMPDGNIVP